MKILRLLSLAALLSTGFIEPRAQAWSGPGHMAVAALAYRELAPADRAKVDKILAAHPAFKAWQKQYPGDVVISADVFPVMMAAMWPDAIRGTADDEPSRHFTTFPLYPPDFPWATRIRKENDALVGLQAALATLRSTRTDDVAKAKALAWLIHIVGDVHQPLHSSSLYLKSLPDDVGDRGGNSLYVTPPKGKYPVSLHSFWDGQFGKCDAAKPRVENVRMASRVAGMARLHHTRVDLKAELLPHSDPAAWCTESRHHAIHDAYQDGKLDYRVATFDHKGHAIAPKQAPRLPLAYVQNARAVSEHRIALAGYRLADLIRDTLK